MDLRIITAISENNVIGITVWERGIKKYELPWGKIPEDISRFVELTTGHPVIMGRKTYESIPERFRPLSERKNIVLTKNPEFKQEGIYIAHSIEEALKLCANRDSYVIGGGKVYRQFLPLSNIMEVTRIHKHVEGDIFFPEVNWREWEETNRTEREGYSFINYQRRQKCHKKEK